MQVSVVGSRLGGSNVLPVIVQGHVEDKGQRPTGSDYWICFQKSTPLGPVRLDSRGANHHALQQVN